jgi:hypothetical protein
VGCTSAAARTNRRTARASPRHHRGRALGASGMAPAASGHDQMGTATARRRDLAESCPHSWATQQRKPGTEAAVPGLEKACVPKTGGGRLVMVLVLAKGSRGCAAGGVGGGSVAVAAAGALRAPRQLPCPRAGPLPRHSALADAPAAPHRTVGGC